MTRKEPIYLGQNGRASHDCGCRQAAEGRIGFFWKTRRQITIPLLEFSPFEHRTRLGERPTFKIDNKVYTYLTEVNELLNDGLNLSCYRGK